MWGAPPSRLSHLETPTPALEWLEARRRAIRCEVRRIEFGDSREWEWHEGVWRHRTGGFFTVRGLRWSVPTQSALAGQQPIMDQPEHGILGFLIQERDGCEQVLVQAKAEPGTTGEVQMAPTVQATESNYGQLHGGRSQPFIEWFEQPDPRWVLVHQLQSEQGTRFLAKRNRNMIVRLPSGAELEHGPNFRWIALHELRELLLHDHVVNTDARSVLAGIPVSIPVALTGMPPTSPTATPPLAHTGVSDVSTSSARPDVDAVRSWLTQSRLRNQVRREVVGLDRLSGWQINEDSIHPVGASEHPAAAFDVIHVHARCSSREVPEWDQPLIETRGQGLVALIAQRRHGTLRVLLRAAMEPGHFDSVECTATVDCIPQNLRTDAQRVAQPFLERVSGDCDGLIWSVRQSDEGGRFFRDETDYRLVLLDEDEVIETPADFKWVTLDQLFELGAWGNQLTNQLRSIVAWLRLSVES